MFSERTPGVSDEERNVVNADVRGEVMEGERGHREDWEAQKREYDYDGRVLEALRSGIDGEIEKARSEGRDSVDLTEPVIVMYGDHHMQYRQGMASKLTGKEVFNFKVFSNDGVDERMIGEYVEEEEKKYCDAMVDGVVDEAPRGYEFEDEIRGEVAEELVDELTDYYEGKGYKVQKDLLGKTIISISWSGGSREGMESGTRMMEGVESEARPVERVASRRTEEEMRPSPRLRTLGTKVLGLFGRNRS